MLRLRAATGQPLAPASSIGDSFVLSRLADAVQWARKYATQAPLALELIKQASHKGDLDDGIAAEKEAFGTAFASEDAREGIGAFLGKRTPEFKGR